MQASTESALHTSSGYRIVDYHPGLCHGIKQISVTSLRSRPSSVTRRQACYKTGLARVLSIYSQHVTQFLTHRFLHLIIQLHILLLAFRTRSRANIFRRPPQQYLKGHSAITTPKLSVFHLTGSSGTKVLNLLFIGPSHAPKSNQENVPQRCN